MADYITEYYHFFSTVIGSVNIIMPSLGSIFLSFVCPKERNKEKGRPNQMLRWFGRANAQQELI